MGNAVLLEFVADGVDYPISQQTEEKVRIGFVIALVIYLNSAVFFLVRKIGSA